MKIRAIRGAIQIGANTPEEIASGVKELLLEILQANQLTPEEVISVILTCTPDLNTAFPATFAREIGFGAVPLLCAVEMDVLGSLPLVIRVMLHAELTSTANHVYLRGATVLRKDLAQ
jgi:chorismate mutase